MAIVLAKVTRLSTKGLLPAAGGVGIRYIGGGIPEFWGKKSKYSPGTDFLGTPTNHLDLIKKRPISPDLFGVDGSLHYKMPVAAISSITNRVTGVAMTGGIAALAVVGLTGDVTVAVDQFKTALPLLVFPAKLSITFPVVYHYLAGMRHLVWDTYKIGNQTEKSLLDKDDVEYSSNALFGVSIALSGIVAVI